MPRIYRRNPDARRARITIPLSEDLLERVCAFARISGLSPTTAAHDLLKRGVEEAAKQGGAK